MQPNATKLWLAPLKFVGMALLFTGIGLALATIVQALRWRSNRLWGILSGLAHRWRSHRCHGLSQAQLCLQEGG